MALLSLRLLAMLSHIERFAYVLSTDDLHRTFQPPGLVAAVPRSLAAPAVVRKELYPMLTRQTVREGSLLLLTNYDVETLSRVQGDGQVWSATSVHGMSAQC